MYDRNLGSYVWCGTGIKARPRCQVCNEQMLPVLFGNQNQRGGSGTAWIWGGDSPKPDSPYWCCSECGVSYMVGNRDALKLPTVDELPEHIRVSEQGEL
mgnify:FL=1